MPFLAFCIFGSCSSICCPHLVPFFGMAVFIRTRSTCRNLQVTQNVKACQRTQGSKFEFFQKKPSHTTLEYLFTSLSNMKLQGLIRKPMKCTLQIPFYITSNISPQTAPTQNLTALPSNFDGGPSKNHPTILTRPPMCYLQIVCDRGLQELAVELGRSQFGAGMRKL